MNNFTYISKCKTCGEFRGLLVDEKDPAKITRGFCCCEPEGWEICSRHKGHARRRFSTVKITSSDGDYRYFSVYAMMAPCRSSTCFAPNPAFLKSVALLCEQFYAST